MFCENDNSGEEVSEVQKTELTGSKMAHIKKETGTLVL